MAEPEKTEDKPDPIEVDGIVHQEADDIPAKIDPEASYDVTLKTGIPDFFGSPLRPGQKIVMTGALVKEHKGSIRVAKISRQPI